jgi:hypothetical protein
LGRPMGRLLAGPGRSNHDSNAAQGGFCCFFSLPLSPKHALKDKVLQTRNRNSRKARGHFACHIAKLEILLIQTY